MKFNVKNLPLHDLARTLKDQCKICVEQHKWKEGFFLETIPRLLKRLDSYKGCIPVDVALQIVREEILGE